MTADSGVEILEFGEDGEWLAAEGHIDLGAFRAAALDYMRDTWGHSDVEDWGDTQPKHTWYRDVDFDDCLRDVVRWYPNARAVERYGLAEKLLDSWREEGWVYPCDGDRAGAEPWTEWRA